MEIYILDSLKMKKGNIILLFNKIKNDKNIYKLILNTHTYSEIFKINMFLKIFIILNYKIKMNILNFIYS